VNLTFSHIERKLCEKYPDSRRIRSGFISEILETFEHSDWTAEQFDAALLSYRERDANYQYPPDFRQLQGYVPQAVSQRSGQRDERLAHLFFNMVVNDGWAEAVRCGLSGELGGDRKQCQALREWMASQGYRAEAAEYFGCDDWFKRFCVLLHHERDPAAAYEFAGANAPEPVRRFYQSRYEIFKRMPLEQAQRYFWLLRGR